MILILLQACTLAPRQQTPQWALSPPEDTSQTLYGVASRQTLDQAKKAALAEIAGKLGTSVQSDTRLKNEWKNDTTTENFVENIKTHVSATQFSHFDVVNSAQIADQYWILIKLNKTAMARELQQKIQLSLKQLDADFTSYNGYSALQKVQASSELKAQLLQLETTVKTLYAIASNYNIEPAMSSLRKKQAQLASARDAIKIKIESDKNTRLFAKKLESYLTDRKFKILNEGSRTGKTVIAISSEIQYFNILNDHQAKMGVNIRVFDETGKVLTTSVHSITGYSRISQRAALDQANLMLAENFNSKGVLNIIGM